MRLFVALDFPPEVRERAWEATAPLREADLPVSWVGPERLHLTLKFIGEVGDSRVRTLSDAVAEVAARHPALPLALRGLGAFPSPRNPRVLWIGVEGPGTLGRLQADVEAALVEHGVEPEDRDFHPHITLGRVERGAGRGRFGDLAARFEEVEVDEEVEVGAVDLVRSVLRRSGAEYSVVDSHALRPHDPAGGGAPR